jgi:hypothetical protein
MVPRLVRILRSRQWRIFERLALYLLSRYPEVDMSLVSASLTDRRNLEEESLRHEYALLAKRGFGKLAVSDKEKVLDFIEQGPDLEGYRFRYEERNHRAPSQEQVDRHANSWRLDRLALFSDDLPEEWWRRYERLVAEFGQPEHPEFTSYMGTTWVGPTSPQTQSDLRSMSSEQITQYLADWRPSGELKAPSADGLGRELGKLIAEAPADFAASSDQFKGLDPTYVRAYFQGLREAVQQERTFSWSPVLDLCQWVIHHPREVHRGYADNREQLQERGLDPDWGWTRKAMADLLSEGFHDNDAQVPYELRDDAWAVVRSLTEDKDPTPEDDLRAAEAGMDPVTLSINTTRGEAMHAVVRYALWVRAHEEEIATEHETLDRGFEAIPEAREVLDKHLDPVEEPSLGVRAVYGMWFPQLLSIDETWVRQRLGEIFPTDVQRRRLRDAVWEAYITVCQPYTSVFRILAGEYERAIEGLDPESNRGSSRRDPDERLAEHLTVFYWAGALNLENSGGLTPRLHARSSTALRRHVLEFVGTTLSRTEEDVPPEVLQRLQRLWLYWVERALALVSPGGHAPELSAFGWWYAAKTFDDAWAIVQLKQALDLAGEIDPADLVLEHLAEVASAFPGYAVECLRLISDSATSGFLLRASLQEVRSILDQVLHSQDREARRRAEGLVHELGARGHWELGDLLTEATAET